MDDTDNEWETIQPSTSNSDSDDSDAVMVVTNPPISAPTHHESSLPVSLSPQSPNDNPLQLQEPEPEPEPPSSPSSNWSSTTPYTSELSSRPPEGVNTILKASLGVLSSWIVRIACGTRSRIGFWSIASVAALVTLAAARRWQRWRRMVEKDETDKLLMLLNQKDEKIKQLLLQIDRMNEALSGRRRVPVFRVVVNSPLVAGPRLN